MLLFLLKFSDSAVSSGSTEGMPPCVDFPLHRLVPWIKSTIWDSVASLIQETDGLSKLWDALRDASVSWDLVDSG